jgi:putative ABC transport system permease protein
MDVFDLFRLAFKALLARKTRSVLTILGITIGAAVIMGLIASSGGLTAGISAQVDKIGANVVIVRAGSSNFLSGSTSSYQLSTQDLSALSSISHVVQVAPYYQKPVTISVGGQSVSGTLIGIDSSVLPTIFKGLSLSEGTFPNSFDPTSAAIGNSIAYPVSSTGAGSQLVGLNQAVSMKIGAGTTSLTFLVKGIFGAYGSALFSNVDESVFVSFQAAQLLLRTPYFSAIYVIVDSADNISSVQSSIQTIYGSDVSVISAGAIASSISAITGQLSVFLGSIGGVSLFVAAIMTANTMFVSVMERTKEIGVLKAIGFRKSQILSMFLSECVVTGIIGGICGTLLGYVLSFILGGALSFGPGRGGGASSPVFSLGLIVFSLFFPIGVSVLAGLYPAWRASRMSPITALKYE